MAFVQDLLGIIKIMILSGWFTLDEYNGRLRTFDFKSYESNDRPQVILEKLKKLQGKAIREGF